MSHASQPSAVISARLIGRNGAAPLESEGRGSAKRGSVGAAAGAGRAWVFMAHAYGACGLITTRANAALDCREQKWYTPVAGNPVRRSGARTFSRHPTGHGPGKDSFRRLHSPGPAMQFWRAPLRP